jgi:hypothetical protein
MSMLDYAALPPIVAEDLARLRRRLHASRIPNKDTDRNLIVGTWNIRTFGAMHPSWDENRGSPKRNVRSLAYLAEVAERFDVLAVQEGKRDLSGVRLLLDWLGPDWGLIVTDVTLGEAGNAERLGFLFDRRRLAPSGLAGEIVLAPTPAGDPARQFARAPYAVGFRAGSARFVLVTAHILFGPTPEDREPEIRALATHVAREMRDRAKRAPAEEGNLLVLGDFNINGRGDDPLFQASLSSGLTVPPPLRCVRTALGGTPKPYDQIAWLVGALDLPFGGRAWVIDISTAVYRDLSRNEMSFRVSDHLPLWAEFRLDRLEEGLARALRLDPAAPDPLSSVQD